MGEIDSSNNLEKGICEMGISINTAPFSFTLDLFSICFVVSFFHWFKFLNHCQHKMKF